MPFRKPLFWIHLTCGLVAGIVILMMSVTGVLLTYDKQMIEWSDRQYRGAPAADQRAPLSELVTSARAYETRVPVTRITVYSDPEAPVAATLAGGRTLYLDPATAEVRGENTEGMRAFLGAIRRWHRWFDITGDGRAIARAVTGWSNVILLFLVFSGLYLWLPRRWSWPHVKLVLFYDRRAKGRARDYNWHNVFGFWTLIPLALVVASAIAISFPWATNLAYRLAGDSPNGTPAITSPAKPRPAAQPEVPPAPPAPFDIAALDVLLAPAKAKETDWRTIAVTVPPLAGSPVSFRIDRGWGGAPQKQTTVTFDASTGLETSYTTFSDQQRGRRFRTYLRFAHTGEYYGLWGQTLAGIVSLAAVLLVWSGFALAWRRLVSPLLKRRVS